MSFANRKIRVKTKTWTRDSYELYDYESTNYHNQTFEISKPGKLIRSNNEINCLINLQANQDAGKEGQMKQESLLTISEAPNGIEIAPNEASNREIGNLWVAAEKGGGSLGYQIKEEDIIKLGRVHFRVKQIMLETDQRVYKSPQEFILASIKDYMIKNQKEITNNNEPTKAEDNEEKGSVPTCKICLENKAEKDNPLISPCKCTGSVRYVHLKCLQSWVKSKLNIEQNNKVLTILWKSLSCELCKSKLPLHFNHEGDDLLLIPYNYDMNGPYMVLDSFSKERDHAGIHIVDLSSKQSFKIGRSNECDLKLNDISVSRVHTILKIHQNKLYVKDNYSKFGTLVSLREPIILNDLNRKTRWIQSGRTVFRFSLKKPWGLVIPCLGPLFGMGKNYDSKGNRSAKEKKTEVPRDRLFTNYDDVNREDVVPQN